jgi:GTP-binding protein YchF
VLDRRIARTAKSAKAGADKRAKMEYGVLQKIHEWLENGNMCIGLELEDEEENRFRKSLDLLTDKPVIYAANVSDEDLADDGASNEYVSAVREIAKEHGSEVFVVSAAIEQEIAELDDEEKAEFLADLGVTRSGLDKLIEASYQLLGLMSFLTTGEDETRAWTIPIGCKAPKAAGKIHSDIERGFIKAEVINYQQLLDCGSYTAAKEKGLVRMEGKEYIVQDGDVILFRFNV